MPYEYPDPVSYGEYNVNHVYPPYPYHYDWYRPQRLGWECPKCHKVFNPDVQQCWTCGNNNATITWSNTITTSNVEGGYQSNDIAGRDGG